MKTNHIVVALIALTAVLQLTTLYQQRQMRGSSQSARSAGDSVKDAPANTILDLKGMPIEGSKDAKVVLIEFSDYECPFCARHATGVAGELNQHFVSNGLIKHVFANNPLPMHTSAKFLAVAALCAGEQGRYWEMNSKLFETKARSESDILASIAALNLNTNTFKECLTNGPAEVGQIDSDIKMAKELSLTATPGFVIGRIETDGRVVAKKVITGAQPLAVFEKAINDVISKQS